MPRSKLLHYPKNATPSQALTNSWLECPHCSFKIREEHKAQCNANGAFVAPGETIDAEGVISGESPETTTLSFWISGFCSPFKTIGERAERYLRALKGPSGKWMWVARYRENHFLDCEAMAAAAAWRIGSDRQKAAKKEINSSQAGRIDPSDYEAPPKAQIEDKPAVAPVAANKAIRSRFANFAQRLNR